MSNYIFVIAEVVNAISWTVASFMALHVPHP